MTKLMTFAEFETLCHSEDRGTWAVFVPCDGKPTSREACPWGFHKPHEFLHSRGLNADHARIVASNWHGKAVDESK